MTKILGTMSRNNSSEMRSRPVHRHRQRCQVIVIHPAGRPGDVYDSVVHRYSKVGQHIEYVLGHDDVVRGMPGNAGSKCEGLVVHFVGTGTGPL